MADGNSEPSKDEQRRDLRDYLGELATARKLVRDRYPSMKPSERRVLAAEIVEKVRERRSIPLHGPVEKPIRVLRGNNGQK